MEAIFYILAFLMLLSALMVVFMRQPVHSALSLLLNMVLTAIVYLAYLKAPFVAVIQVIVYMGAVVVFVLFVIMLMDLSNGGFREVVGFARFLFAFGIALVFLLQFLFIGSFVTGSVPIVGEYIQGDKLAEVIFTKYALPFEVVSILIFSAVVGAVAMAKKRA